MAVTIKDLRFSIYLNNADAKKTAIETQRLLQAVGDEMKQLAAEGKKDTPAYREKKKAFDAMTASMEKSKLEAGLLGMSMKELRRLAITMKNDMSRMIPDSAEWKKLDADIKVVDNRIDVLRGTVKKTEGSLGKMANGFNKYFTMFTTGIAAMTGVIFGAKQIVEGNAELSDSFADVQKTTNLTRQEVEGLYKDFKSLDTRTARKELLQLASDAGKLGISGSKNILDFVDAGNQIKVSLGEDLGEDAIKNIGKMVGVFGNSTKELQRLGLKEQMLAIGSAVNSIGQSSSASEQYLVAFAGRLGGVSKQAGIGIDKILGYASALDQDMQQVEMSATALQQFIMKVMGDPAKFAKLAGVSVKEFTTLLSTDANAAIVKVLKSLNDKGGFQALIPIFQDMGTDGARAVGVLSSLAGSIDKIEKEQALANKSMVEGNSITKEYNIRNNNLAASLAKLNQNINSWFKNSAITAWLGELVSKMEKATNASKSATQEFESQSEKVISLKSKIEPLLTRYDELATKTNKSATENDELKRIITEVTAVMPGATTAVDKYGNAISISTGRVREFINAEISRLNVLNKTAIYDNTKLLNETKERLAGIKKTIDEINRTGTYSIAKSYGDGDTKFVNASQDEILAVQNRYKQLLSDKVGYQAEIDRLSGATLKKQMDDADAAQKILDDKAAKEKAYYLMSKSELKKLMDAKDELAKRVYNEKFPANVPAGDDPDAETKKEKAYKLAEDALSSSAKRRQIITDDMYMTMNFSENLYNKMSEENTIKSLNEKLALQKKFGKDTADTEKAISDAKLKRFESDKKINENFKKQFEEFKKLDAPEVVESENVINTENYTLALRLQILEAFHNKGLKSEKEYQTELAGLLKGNQKEINKYLKDTGLKDNEQRYKDGIIGEKQYLDNNRKIYAEYIDEKFAKEQQLASDISMLANAAADLSATMQDSALQKVDNKYAAELKSARKAGKDTTALEAKIEEEKKQVKKKYADVDFAITVAQIIASTASAVMNALKLPPPFGEILAGIVSATGLAQIDVANQQRMAVKNLWTGGFTDNVGERTPAGVVHGGEFVANAKAVRNPRVKKFLDVFDMAQKNGTIHMLNTTQILEQVRTQPQTGYQGGGYAQTPGGAAGTMSNDVAMAIISENTRAMNRLNGQLDKGIRSINVISGDGGIAKLTELYEKLKSNATRGS